MRRRPAVFTVSTGFNDMHAKWAILGFLASSALLLAVSWALVLTPGLVWRGKASPGVPVKDYILQSEIFAICAFGLIAQAAELWRTQQRLSLVLVLLAAAFIANIGYVVTARTTLVVMAVLLIMFAVYLHALDPLPPPPPS